MWRYTALDVLRGRVSSTLSAALMDNGFIKQDNGIVEQDNSIVEQDNNIVYKIVALFPFILNNFINDFNSYLLKCRIYNAHSWIPKPSPSLINLPTSSSAHHTTFTPTTINLQPTLPISTYPTTQHHSKPNPPKR